MSNVEFIGLFVVAVLPSITAVASIIKPIIGLNASITELNCTMKALTKTTEKAEDKLNDHEKRIVALEAKEN